MAAAAAAGGVPAEPGGSVGRTDLAAGPCAANAAAMAAQPGGWVDRTDPAEAAAAEEVAVAAAVVEAKGVWNGCNVEQGAEEVVSNIRASSSFRTLIPLTPNQEQQRPQRR